MKNKILFRFFLIFSIGFTTVNIAPCQTIKYSKLFSVKSDNRIVGNKITFDKGKVYFTATRDSSSYRHTLLFCYDVGQSKILWSRKISLMDNYVNPVNIRITNDGNILLGAYDYAFNQQLSGTNMLFLLFDSGGTLKWKNHIGGLENEQLRDFFVDKDNNICFIGDYYGQLQYLCLFGKLDKNCDLISLNAVKKSEYNYPFDIIQLSNGKYLFGGSTAFPNEPHKGFITLTDKDMNIIKSVELNTPGLQNYVNKIYEASDNTVYVFSEYSSIAYCFKFNDTLKLLDQFEISYGDITSVFENDKEIIIENSKAGWLGKLNDKSYQSIGAYQLEGLLYSVDFDKNKNVVFGTGYSTDLSTQKVEAVLIEHSLDHTSNCAFHLYTPFGGKETNLLFTPFQFTKVPMTVKILSADEIIVKNETDYTFNLECENFLNTMDETQNEDFLIYPNPSAGYIEIQNEFTDEIEITDLSGRSIMKVSGSDTKIDISMLRPGFYLFRSGTKIAKLIKL